jgi:hypothetical protein
MWLIVGSYRKLKELEMKLMMCAVAVMITAIVSPALADDVLPPAIPGLAGFNEVELVKVNSSMFSSNKLATIPKDWKLVSVSNGEKPNFNNLWFQDKDGNIIVLDGYMDGKTFFFTGHIQKLEVK